MGYRIQYSPETNKRYPVRKNRKSTLRILLIGLTLIFFILTVKYRASIARMMLPGDPDVTSAALRGLVADIRSGNTGDAIAAFCREIISHAEG